MSSWFKNGISMDETKNSAIVLIFILNSIFIMVMYWFDRDISSNLMTINLSLLGIIGGVNGVSMVTKTIENVKSKKKLEVKEGDSPDSIQNMKP